MAELVIDLLRDCTAAGGVCQANPEYGEKVSALRTPLIGDIGLNNHVGKPIELGDVRLVTRRTAVGVDRTE